MYFNILNTFRLRRLKLKFQCLTLKGYREFLILDPAGIPLKSLDHIFLQKENRSVYRVAAPVADAVEIAAATLETGVGRPTCFGDVAPLVSSDGIIKIAFFGLLKFSGVAKPLLRCPPSEWPNIGTAMALIATRRLQKSTINPTNICFNNLKCIKNGS